MQIDFHRIGELEGYLVAALAQRLDNDFAVGEAAHRACQMAVAGLCRHQEHLPGRRPFGILIQGNGDLVPQGKVPQAAPRPVRHPDLSAGNHLHVHPAPARAHRQSARPREVPPHFEHMAEKVQRRRCHVGPL